MSNLTKQTDYAESNTGERVRRVSVLSPAGTTSHNRERTTVAGTVEKVTFPAESDVRNLTITVMHTVAAPADESAGIAICFNAADLTQATSYLAAIDSESADIERYVIPANSIIDMSFGDAVKNAYFVAIGAGSETLRVHISGGTPA